MNFSKDMVFKQIDTVICDLRHLLISMEEFQENGDINKLQKRIEDLERELKFWQDRYNELYKNYLELLSCPRQKYQPIWINKTRSPNSFTFTL